MELTYHFVNPPLKRSIMFREGKIVAALLLIMVLSRFTLAFMGYFAQEATTRFYGFNFDPGDPVLYFAHLWASRDMIVAVTVLTARRNYLIPVVLMSIAIDLSDILSAFLSGYSGSLDAAHVNAQLWTIILPALLPEVLALLLIRSNVQRAA